MNYFERINEMENYVDKFCEIVLGDVINRSRITRVKEKDAIDYPSNYIGNDNRFGVGMNVGTERYAERAVVVPRLNTLLGYIYKGSYRFEEYFSDLDFVYPFGVENSLKYFSALDNIHKDNAENFKTKMAHEQITINIVSSIRYILRQYKFCGDDPIIHLFMNAFVDKRRTQRILFQYDPMEIKEILRVSYLLEVHPYELMGLKRVIYPHELFHGSKNDHACPAKKTDSFMERKRI